MTFKHSTILSFYCLLAVCLLFPATAKADYHYPGISAAQDSLAYIAMDCIAQLQWDKAEHVLKEQMSLELDNNLPPLSFLLRVSIRVFRIQNDEYENNAARKKLLHEIDRLTDDGLSLVANNTFSPSVRPTLYFIEGGIRGFTATLQVNTNPIKALTQGYKALKYLDSARILEPRIQDAYLGSGLFNCILAKYPKLLRTVLRIIDSHPVSMASGLSQLRLCAEHAHYTREAAKLYLIQFLSPYYGDQAQEKRAIFASLEQAYPFNPYFVFLAMDEAFTFYPDSIALQHYANRLQRKIPQLSTSGFSCRRYANLVKWQYSFFDTTVTPELAPDPIPEGMPFSYYPDFISGVRAKHYLMHDKSLPDASRKEYRTMVKMYQDSANDLLDASSMNQVRKDYFAWHIHDGLRLK